MANGLINNMEDYQEYIRELRKVEKNMGVVLTRIVRITYTTPKQSQGEFFPNQILYETEIPHDQKFYERWSWYFNWRMCWYQCKKPKNHIRMETWIKETKTNSKYNLNSVISKYVGAKAQITKYKRIIREYEEEHKQTLFGYEDDPIYKKACMILKVKESKLKEAQAELEKTYKGVFNLE